MAERTRDQFLPSRQRRPWRPLRGSTIKLARRSGYRSRGKYWFDVQAAANAREFIERFCSHTKGELAGEPLILDPWELDLVENLFGWKRKDHKDPQQCTRRFRVLYLEVPRKNGKSTLSAALALILLFIDQEPGAEIYSAAANKDQANIVFDVAKSMVLNHPQLSRRAAIFGGTTGANTRTIVLRDRDGEITNSVYRVLPGEADGLHGLNAHGVVVDEVHVQKKRDLIDTLKTSTGSRRQPVEIYITTAGTDRLSICWELHKYALDVIADDVVDDAFLPYVFGAGENDDWTREDTWRRANPGYGTSVKPEYLAAECQRAMDVPGYQNTFRRLHLNQWTQQDRRWLDMRRWDRCAALVQPTRQRYAYAGLDLASVYDLSALVLAFPPEEDDDAYDLLPFFWVPADTLAERVERDRVPYDVWAAQGHLRTTPGEITDYDTIRRDINDLGIDYRIKEIACDRWDATQIMTQLDGDGFTVFKHGMGFASMRDPCKQFEAAVRAGKLRHGAHPILRWNAANTAVEENAAGDLKPSKVKSTERIDGIVAAIMAVGRAQLAGLDRSVYTSQRRDGLLVIS